MKKIYTLIAILFCLNSYSQSKFNPWVAYADGSSTDFEIVAHSEFVNKFGSQMLKWVRIQNSLETGWTSAYCDCEACRSDNVDSADFTIGIGDSCPTSAHFYANKIKGNGVVKIKMFAKDNPGNFVIGEYRVYGWGVSVNYIEKERLIVSPNPANSLLKVGFGSGEAYTISIITVAGKVLVKERVEALSNTMDISAFAKGLYSVKVESAGKVFYSKFLKL